jgi:hypothetical protein
MDARVKPAHDQSMCYWKISLNLRFTRALSFSTAS